jgi:hypothetical protein
VMVVREPLCTTLAAPCRTDGPVGWATATVLPKQAEIAAHKVR